MKTCSICKAEKPATEFYRGRSCCKLCHNSISRAYNKTVTHAQKKNRNLKARYGITLEQYVFLLEQQGHRCAVCQRHQDEFPRDLAVDHNHKTRRIRGLLCINCNHRLIGRHTDGELLRRMADYVEQGTDWYVPEKKKRTKRK